MTGSRTAWLVDLVYRADRRIPHFAATTKARSRVTLPGQAITWGDI